MNEPPRAKTAIRIANTFGELTRVVEFVEKFGRDHGVPESSIDNLNLCLDEILNNTISYGYGDTASHVISVILSVEGRFLVAEIEDDANPFDPRRSAPPDLPRDFAKRKLGGLGLHFVNSLMDVVDYRRNEGYNRTTLKKSMQPSAGASERGI